MIDETAEDFSHHGHKFAISSGRPRTFHVYSLNTNFTKITHPTHYPNPSQRQQHTLKNHTGLRTGNHKSKFLRTN